MFCQECGAKNAEEAAFCENCGAKLKHEEEVMQKAPYQNADVQSIPPRIEKWKWILGIELVAIVVLLVFAYQNAQNYFGAAKVAERYFIAVANDDWNQAYQMLELDESDFINEESYEKMVKENQLPKITSYVVGNKKIISGKQLGTTVEIKYRSKGDSSDSTYTVSLNKQPKKRFLLFDDWMVSTDSIISKDVCIRVPQGAKVQLDGNELPSSYITKKEDNLDTYVIPALFSGIHNVKAAMEGMEDDNGKFNTMNSGEYVVRSMQPSQETMDELIRIAGEDMQKVYSAALHGDSFSTIADLYTKNKDYAGEIEREYDSFLKSTQGDNNDITNTLRISNISASAVPYEWGSEPAVEVNLDFDYSVDFSYEDFWTGDMRQNSYDSSDSITYNFIYEDGEWLPSNFGCHILYYY